MSTYKKKPVEVEAVEWTGENVKEITAFIPEGIWFMHKQGDVSTLFINTLEGQHKAIPTDMIIRGVSNEYYPCKRDIFDKTYDKV